MMNIEIKNLLDKALDFLIQGIKMNLKNGNRGYAYIYVVVDKDGKLRITKTEINEDETGLFYYNLYKASEVLEELIYTSYLYHAKNYATGISKLLGISKNEMQDIKEKLDEMTVEDMRDYKSMENSTLKEVLIEMEKRIKEDSFSELGDYIYRNFQDESEEDSDSRLFRTMEFFDEMGGENE